jgi:hypothetical protein
MSNIKGKLLSVLLVIVLTTSQYFGITTIVDSINFLLGVLFTAALFAFLYDLSLLDVGETLSKTSYNSLSKPKNSIIWRLFNFTAWVVTLTYIESPYVLTVYIVSCMLVLVVRNEFDKCKFDNNYTIISKGE